LVLNADGVVIGRWSASLRINRTLNRSVIEPGRLFDEASAGTTGLGTPLENGHSAIVEGAEHALAALDSLTAVGTPIIHPTRGSVEGVIDIVGAVGVETTMMLPLVAQAARDIGERLVAGYAAEDRALMDAFLTAERRGPKRPILAINDRLIIGNAPGNELGLAAGHVQLWETTRIAISQQIETISVPRPQGSDMVGKIVAIGDTRIVGALVHLETGAPLIKPEARELDGESIRRARNETAFSDLERSAIRRALVQTSGNKRDAAEVLGVSRATLYRKMARLGLRT
jgi:transcriptional regulator of acetoin/glycerol metabolism